MGRFAQQRFQLVSFAAIGVLTVAGVIWIVRPSFESSDEPLPEGLAEQIEQTIAFSRMDSVVARVGEIEVLEGTIEGALAAGQNSSRPFDRNQIIREGIDSEIAIGLKLRIAEREGLVGSLEEAVRQMELNRASCEADVSCRAFVDGIVSAGLADSTDEHWQQTVTAYQENISVSNVDKLLAGDPAVDIRLQSDIEAWRAEIAAAEQRMIADVQIEWLDPDYRAAYLAASN